VTSVRQKQEGVEILVPCEEERIGADRDQRRRHQREVDQPKQLERRSAVDIGGLVEFLGQLVGGLLEDPDRVGRGECEHREDQRPLVIEKPVKAHGAIHRHREECGGNEIGEQREAHHRAPAFHLEAADGERRACRHQQGEDAGRDRDEERIPQLQPKMIELTVILSEHDGEIVERRVLRPQIAFEGGLLGRHREQHHVVDRRERPQQHGNADQQELGFGGDSAERRQLHFDIRFIMK
jgi:hypothetical protein